MQLISIIVGGLLASASAVQGRALPERRGYFPTNSTLVPGDRFLESETKSPDARPVLTKVIEVVPIPADSTGAVSQDPNVSFDPIPTVPLGTGAVGTGALRPSSEAAPQPTQFTTSTIFATQVHTITSCAETVTNCPASATVVVTEIIAVSTTVCPVTEAGTEPTGVAGGESEITKVQTTVEPSSVVLTLDNSGVETHITRTVSVTRTYTEVHTVKITGAPEPSPEIGSSDKTDAVTTTTEAAENTQELETYSSTSTTTVVRTVTATLPNQPEDTGVAGGEAGEKAAITVTVTAEADCAVTAAPVTVTVTAEADCVPTTVTLRETVTVTADSVIPTATASVSQTTSGDGNSWKSQLLAKLIQLLEDSS